MTEEYMTSAEIREKIAELKIRLAFQLEFEEELEKTLAECQETASEKQPTDRDAEIFRKIEAETRRRNSRKVGRRRARRVRKIVVIAAMLMMISVGSALAAICGLVEAGVLKFDVKVQEKGTIFELLQLGNKVDVPEGWKGEYFPSYIPEGYWISDIGNGWIVFANEDGQEIHFNENAYGYRQAMDTENATVCKEMLNGIEAFVVEKSGVTMVVWQKDDVYFAFTTSENKNTALKIAASVERIK